METDDVKNDAQKQSFIVSQPVIREQDGKYYIAVFIVYPDKYDKLNHLMVRPSRWILADIATGNIVKDYQCKYKDFSNESFDKKYDVIMPEALDTSKEYYYKTYGYLDRVRADILSQDKINNKAYNNYMNRILANIPVDYQRFYWDLSI